VPWSVNQPGPFDADLYTVSSNPLHWQRGRYLIGVGVCFLLGWVAFVRGSSVPLLALVDLGFHELGHLLTYPFPDVVTAMMGSIAQVAVPLGVALYFLFLRRERLGAALCLAWAATSAQNVSVYIADAPIQALPLLGEGMHDWAFVLGRFDAIDSAATIAAFVKGFGMILLFAGFALCVWSLLLDEAPATRTDQSGAPTPAEWTSR
jgi:hypothetical protein